MKSATNRTSTPPLPKLTPPRRRSDTIRRTRLHHRLSDALEHDVLVISAPAGYGKSTLVVDWLGEVGLPAGWLSLDRQDRDPVTLVSDLTAAVRTVAPDALESFVERLRKPGDRPDPQALIAEFAAAVQSEVEDLFLLVVDDLNALDGADSALEVLDALAQSIPLSMRLVILTRSWTLLPSLPRLTAQRRAFSLTVQDLQFTDDESLELLRTFGRTETGTQSLIVSRADGWAAALAILGDHAEGASPSDAAASDFILADFIDHEVLRNLDDDQLNLLDSAAVLQSFDVPLVRELSGRSDAARQLRELERATHLIVRLEDGSWYRIHAILREHLVGRLEREDPGRLLEVRRAAAALYARRGMRREAVAMALDAEDWPEALREIRELREEIYQRGEWSTLVGWLDRLPVDVLESDADLALARARQALKSGDGRLGLSQLDAVDEVSLGPEQKVRRRLYQSVGMRHIGHLSDALDACRAARALANELVDDEAVLAELDLEEGIALGMTGLFAEAGERFHRGSEAFERLHDQHRAAECYDGRGSCLGYLGQFAEAMDAFTTAQRLWRSVGDIRQQITTMGNIGELQRIMGELDTAADTFNGVIQRSRDLHFLRGEAYGQDALAAIQHDRGEFETAASLRSFALQSAQTIDDPALIASVTLGLALVYRDQGQLLRARSLLEHGLRTSEQGGMFLYRAQFRSALGSVLLLEGRQSEALLILEEALAEAQEAAEPRDEAIAHLRLAACLLTQRQRTRGLDQLQRVAELAQKLGYTEFLYVDARKFEDAIELGVARRVGGAFFRSLRERIPAIRTESSEHEEQEGTSEAQIRAEAFGTPRVLVSGRQVSDLEWRSERSKEMFFFLLQSGRPLRKEQIAVELWPDVAQDQINSAFHSTLYRLRKAIDKQIVIQTDGGYQVSDAFDIAYDAREFDEHMKAAEDAKPGTKRWLDEVLAAIRLYRGPFAEPYESEWAGQARQGYEDRYVSSLVSLAAQALRRGEYLEVVTLTESILAIDRLNEEAVRYQMQAHARSGHLELAARSYRRLHEALRDELGEEPSTVVRAEYERVISGAALDS